MWKGKNAPTRDLGQGSQAQEFTDHFIKGREFLLQAVTVDEKFDDTNASKKREACELYKKGIDEFRKASEINTMDVSPAERKSVADAKEKIDGFLRSAEERFVKICQKLTPQTASTPRGATGSSSLPGPARTATAGKRVGRANSAAASSVVQSATCNPPKSVMLRGVDPKFGERLLEEVLEGTGVLLADVAGCETAKLALEEAVILPSMNPALFSGLRQPVKGILLFGPPGNGKTMLAKAVATESKQMFFNMSAASLTSKWVGDGEKTVRSLFQIARNVQPSIIFIDEIDSILCDRNEKESEASRRIKTEFLVQFDGATSSGDDRILVIGATNRPQELDDAVLRRFPKRILLGLPDDAGRATLIKAVLTKHGMREGIQDSDVRYIASRTSGYSNSDLVELCKEAAMVPVRSIAKNKIASTDLSKIRPLMASDFDKALTVIKPSTNLKHMDVLNDFARRSGQQC